MGRADFIGCVEKWEVSGPNVRKVAWKGQRTETLEKWGDRVKLALLRVVEILLFRASFARDDRSD
jgi:hypothetical protein